MTFCPRAERKTTKVRYRICRDQEEAPEGADLVEDHEVALAGDPEEADLAVALTEEDLEVDITTIITITMAVGGITVRITTEAADALAAFWAC